MAQVMQYWLMSQLCFAVQKIDFMKCANQGTPRGLQI